MERREPVSLSRAVEVTLVPSGEKSMLPQGAMVMPQQELGGHFTIMLDRGGLARLANEDADALGPAFAERARKVAEAEDLFRRFHAMVVEGDASQADGLGKLAVLKGVADFPTRVKCASLAWHALHSALRGDTTPATTE